MSKLLRFLTKNNYIPLEKHKFRVKVKAYLGISDFEDGRDILYFSHPKGYDIDIKNQFIDTYEVELYFLQEMKILEEGVFNEDNFRFVCYNKIIFNDDIFSINQILHDKKKVEDVVIYFDYEKNPTLLNTALNNIDTNNNETIYIEHLIFYNDKSKKDFIKRNFLLKILGKNEAFFITIIQNLIKFWNSFSAHNSYKYQAIAYMFEIFLNDYHEEEYDLNSTAYIILNNTYIEKQEIFQNFKNNNYYHYHFLKEYSQFFLISQKT